MIVKQQKLQYIYYSLLIIVCVFIFCFLLYCNNRTPYLADDYLYMYDLSNNTGMFPPLDAPRIESIWQIFPSMVAHRQYLNGRVIAHFFTQLFLMFPKAIFNIVNSFVFVLQILLIFCISISFDRVSKHYFLKLLLFISIFTSIWIFQPKFGQVNLWLDGSINYLWASVVSLIYIYLFLKLFTLRPIKHKAIYYISLFVVAFIAGAYCENSSISIIFFTIATIVASFWTKKAVHKRTMFLVLASTVLGFFFWFPLQQNCL